MKGSRWERMRACLRSKAHERPRAAEDIQFLGDSSMNSLNAWYDYQKINEIPIIFNNKIDMDIFFEK